MISVAMATCQGERWLEPQLSSILDQLGPHDEIVVADASSTDRTLEIVRDLCGDQARIVEGIRRGSPPATFEAALKECRGAHVFLSDQDDIWLPGKVEACRQALDRNGPAMVLHDAKVIDADGRILSESFMASRNRHDGFWHNLWRPSYLGCAIALRRELLDTALPFPADVPMHDWWIGLLAERSKGVAFLPEPYLLHRRHGRNANFDPNRSPYSFLERIGFRWRIWRDVGIRLKDRA